MSKYLNLIDLISEKYSDMTPVIDIINELVVGIEKNMPDLKEYKKAMKGLERLAYDINKDEAEDIIKKMRPYGMKWHYADIEKFVREKGVKGDYQIWWLVMNMVYNDYHPTAEKYQMADNPDFYFSLASNFINDVDGDDFKVQKYFLQK